MPSFFKSVRNFLEDWRRLGVLGAVTLRCHRFVRKLGFSAKHRLFPVRAPGILHPFYARFEASDLEVFDQIFKEREYACLSDIKAKLIVDCGANVGYSSIWFLNRFPDARLIALEPDEGNFDLCRRNLRPYGRRASLFHSAAWPDESALTIVRGRYRDGREWTYQVRECLEEEKPDVRGTNISTLLRGSGFETIDILKVDVEGAEAMIFRRNYENWLARVRNIVIELHDEECARIFFRALSSCRYDLSKSGDLTVCRDISLKG